MTSCCSAFNILRTLGRENSFGINQKSRVWKRNKWIRILSCHWCGRSFLAPITHGLFCIVISGDHDLFFFLIFFVWLLINGVDMHCNWVHFNIVHHVFDNAQHASQVCDHILCLWDSKLRGRGGDITFFGGGMQGEMLKF